MENLSQLISRRLNELRLSKSDLATLIGKSRAYVGDLANGTAGTQSGQYRPSPAVITSLATHLKVTEAEILNAIGYNAGKPETRKPQNLPELIEALEHLGIEIDWATIKDGFQNYTPDDF